MSAVLEQIKQQFERINTEGATYSEGVVVRYGDGIVTASGLLGVSYSEIVKVYVSQERYVLGLVFSLEEVHTGIILLEDAADLTTGARIISTGEIFSITVSDALLGRNINILGEPIDGLGEIIHNEPKSQLVEKKAYGVIQRKSVSIPLQTGLISIDALIPVGRGQRELIIGDRQTGKTALALDVIINQGRINRKIDSGEINGKKIYSIYVAVGQKQSKIAQLVAKLRELDVLDYCTIVTASASDTASAQYLAPYVGTAIGEFFMERGDDALVIYDDLSKQAKAYRQISLLLRRPPGREAYPGDVFYLHSRLLERAARLSDEMGGGSLTALPIIETQAGDVSAYIPTNVISITDGQIYLTSELFNAGIKPAVNVGISVSRVGSSAQIKAMKQVAGPLKLNLAQFRELQAFAQFGVEVDASTQRKIDAGLRLTETLKQNLYSGLPVEKQVAILWVVTRGFADSIVVDRITSFCNAYITFLDDMYGELLANIRSEEKITEETEEKLKEISVNFVEEYKSSHSRNM